MALADTRLSLLAFPQRWTGADLQARVLLLPTGDPTVPPSPADGLPAFAGTSWDLRAVVLPGPDALLGPNPGTTAGAVALSFPATPPPGAAALFAALGSHFPIVTPDDRATRLGRLAGSAIRKHLPASYTSAFPFERPGPGTSVGTEFGCALRDTPGALPGDPPPPPTVTWGAVLSLALRQPLLARALGLIHDVTIPGAAGAVAQGGWLYVELDPAGPVTPVGTDTVRRYGSLLPPLAAGPAGDRPVFAAVLFPVGLTGAGDYGAALAEAAIYDDGFAKVVHAAQATTADATSSGHNELRPATDAGLDLGWDDEQVTAWLNRQLDGLRARLDPTVTAVQAPLGVSGYRVDVRMPDVAALDGWTSLCQAAGALVFPPAPAAAVFQALFEGELTVEPAPARSVHATDGANWLPQHFTRWQDGSLVANDPTLFQLAGTTPADANGNPMAVPPPTYAAPPVPVKLRYGQRYEFRCRFADLTGGGPGVGDDPRNPAPAPTATARFLRQVPPKPVRIQSDIARPAAGQPTPPVATVGAIEVWRPLIGYPEMTFAGIDDPAVVTQLLASAAAARAAGDAVGVNDPDVTAFKVSVDVRLAAHDVARAGSTASRDPHFRELYTTEIAFPAFDRAHVFDRGAPVTLTLSYVDQADIATIAAPAAGATDLPVPRARDIRLRLAPICAPKADYFGDDAVREGLDVTVATRAPAASEAGVFAAQATSQQLRAMLLQPGADLVARLAGELELGANELTLTARPGQRVVFGASAGLRHGLAPDGSAITFATAGELLGHWITAIDVEIARDWTWDGLADDGIVVSRRDHPGDALQVVGRVAVPFTVSALALASAGSGAGTVTGPPVDPPGFDRRAQTRVVFFDVVDPNPPADAFPTLATPSWVLEPVLRDLPAGSGAAEARTLDVRLPVAVPPRQTPKLVSAGIALSPYQRAGDYSSTSPRDRVLWFEFEEPVADPNDALFARVTAYGPDPLLSGQLTHLLIPAPDVAVGPLTWFQLIESLLPTPPEPPGLAVDPEPLRVVVPGQPEDSSGLDAMVEMTGSLAAPARHFILPLPPGVDPQAPDLFGFWSYELRIGHQEIWSTAQARFGRPLVVKGVQHPPPALRCAAFREQLATSSPAEIIVSAPHATAVFQDQRLTDAAAGDPRTRIWVLLYTQVTQADGAGQRNVLVGRAAGVPQRGRGSDERVPETREVISVAHFNVDQVEQALADLALPAGSPLSVIAVEMLPGDNLVQRTGRVGDHEVYFNFDAPASASASASGASGASGNNVAALVGSLAAVNVSGVGSGDPLGVELGSMASRRILRCSPLTPVAAAC